MKKMNLLAASLLLTTMSHGGLAETPVSSSTTCPQVEGEKAQEIMCWGEGLAKTGLLLSDGFKYTRGVHVFGAVANICGKGPQKQAIYRGELKSEGNACKYNLPNGETFTIVFKSAQNCPDLNKEAYEKVTHNAEDIQKSKIKKRKLPDSLASGSMHPASVTNVVNYKQAVENGAIKNDTMSFPLKGSQLKTKVCKYTFPPNVDLTGIEQVSQ